MKIAQKYSHLNGEEYLIVHHNNLYKEIKEVIASIAAKVKKEENRYIHRWEDENISVENDRWAPIIKFGKKKIRLPKKKDDTRYTPEEADSHGKS